MFDVRCRNLRLPRCSSLPTNLPRSKTGSSTCNSQPVTNPQHPVFLNSNSCVLLRLFAAISLFNYSFFIIQFLQSLPRLFRLRTCGVSPRLSGLVPLLPLSSFPALRGHLPTQDGLQNPLESKKRTVCKRQWPLRVPLLPHRRGQDW